LEVHHKFKNHNWFNGFSTENSILRTPYEPMTMFIGTFNHGWDWNRADFFYGRDMYMWPILANLFLYNRNHLTAPRNEKSNQPTLDEIFEICRRGKITFADIVSGTKLDLHLMQKDKSILIDDHFEWNNYSDKQINRLGNFNCLDDNADEIVKYIQRTKSIKYIYFTFKSESWLIKKRDQIVSNLMDREAGSIFTPTGMGFRKNLEGFPGRLESITHCWVWNFLDHKTKVGKKGYTHLNHHWLKSQGVEPSNF
jgi:hypothetical protein